MSDDAKKAKWFQTHQKAWGGFTGLSNRLIDSPAFAELSSAAAVRTLTWFWQEARYPETKRRRGQDHYIGRVDQITNNGKISFTYQQAGWRGMNPRRFSRVLKELHRLGFIDVTHLGRGVKGEYSKFALSIRWQKYGTPGWEEIPFPENFREGFREKGKNNGHKRPLLTDTNVRYEVVKLPDNGHERPLKTAPDANSQRTPTSVSKDSYQAVDADLDGDGLERKVKEKGLESDRAQSRRDNLQPSNGKLKLSDLRKHVADILERNLPEGNVRNVNYISSQLWDVAKGRLDPEKVRASIILTVSYMPDTIINTIMADLFTLIGHSTKAKIRFAKPKVIPWMGSPAETAALLANWGPM